MRVPVVIVGGGIAGLSAAWRLQKRGFDRFVAARNERAAGRQLALGRERDDARIRGARTTCRFRDERATTCSELFAELGVLKPDGTWDERYLCLAPQERLFIYGRWQEGIEPAVGLTAADREQFRRLAEVTDALRATGRFTVPLDVGLSSQDESLDRMSFAAWLAEHRFDSKPLLWYVNYVCRDDYGATGVPTCRPGPGFTISRRATATRRDRSPGPRATAGSCKQLLERVGRFVRPGQPVRSDPARRVRRSGFAPATPSTAAAR